MLQVYPHSFVNHFCRSNLLQDRSDDDESDHTSDPYLQHMRGRVSPSPYTANTERARLFNVCQQRLSINGHGLPSKQLLEN